MNDKPVTPGADAAERDQSGNKLDPLPGEPGIPDVARPARVPLSKKGLLAVGLLIATLVAVSAISLQRFATSGRNPDDAASARVGDKPAAAGTTPRRLEIPSVPASAASAPSQAVRIPQLVPTAEETAEPIGVRRTGAAQGTGSSKAILPQDAPVVVLASRPGMGSSKAGPRDDPASDEPANDQAAGAGDALDETRRNLVAYQRQLDGLLDTLNKGTAAAAGHGAVPPPPLGAPPIGVHPSGGATQPPPTGGLFGGQLQASATPRVTASMLGNRSLTLPKGTAFTCALKTKVISAASGFVGCQVLRNVFSDDGRVLLIERGSHMDGEYRVASLRSGTIRIPVLWTRIRTPNGVTVDIESPGTGPLGESGVDGYVDNRWVERIGAALLLSLINDSVQFVLQNQTNDSSGDTIILPSTTSSTNKLAEKVLENTINIPPLIYQNQGGIVGIYVARDVDFSSVYELKPVSR
ncbi:MAG TPA: type IV secretion system protein VirB10 [Rubrivivax sp.]|nr:type IV secretion system protein VirB10 [Rubrivivax sp.]